MSNISSLQGTNSEAIINFPINYNTHTSYTIGKIASALSKAQGELESSKKDNSGYGYNYSDLATVIATAKPVLAKHGLAITQLIGAFTNVAEVVTILVHSESGEFFKATSSIPIIEMKNCNAAQNFGASLSYLRRYSYQAILGMASEDNDASSEGFKKNESYSKPAPKTETLAPEAKKSTTFKRVTSSKTTTAGSTTGANDDL
jgi:hypothetical protein